MLNGFTKGLLIGSILGTSIGVMMDTSMMKRRNRRKMMKAGRSFLRRTGNIISAVVEAFR
ncbi:MAG: YtxH domain-containing protein [Clostridiaceae bacterium]|nr:YtxH domain-containing protein [Clostridiaceae bacterium]